MPYVAAKWVLETKKSPKRDGYAIVEISEDFLNLIEASQFIFKEIDAKFQQQKIKAHTRQNFKCREYDRYKKNAHGQKIYAQRKDLPKQPFIAVKFPIFWRKKHIQTFFSLFKFKHWTKITWKDGKEIVPANHDNIILVLKNDLPENGPVAIVIL